MPEEILINVTSREVRIALIEDSVLQEIYIERNVHQGLLGNIYKGRVKRLLPGIQAAFVDIGLERAAFLHANDLADPSKQMYAGQDLLVQVYKDPLGSKGARLTTQYTVPSRYLVLTPGIFQISVSQKITDEIERERLTNLILPGQYGGYIFRTAAEGVTALELERDKALLDARWQQVILRLQTAKAGELINAEIPMVLRVVRDLAHDDILRIRVDDQKIAEDMQQFASQYVPKWLDRIEYYQDSRPIFDIHGIENELQKTLERKVSLKCGGYLIFDQTEAMTTIDVNTGSYIGHINSEQAVLNTNLEAAEMIARQVRLRNLGGIIIVDFIDMENPLHKMKLLQSLTDALAKDSARTEVSELSSLGLVQMTRKRTRESLEHILCVPCPLCRRRGSIKSVSTVAYDIFRELKRLARHHPWPGFLVIAAEDVINCLREEESTLLAEIAAELGKPVQLRVELSYHQEHYAILPMSDKE